MTKLELARQVVNKIFDNDAFSRWLGIDIVEIRPGRAVLQMKVREDMLNGFDVCHGGITFSLADSA
ncbi:MAG: hotdog fold thioesterase, partial [bacterium]